MRSFEIKKSVSGMLLSLPLLIIILGHSAFAADSDDSLLRRAKQIFGKLPKVMKSEKNPITPEKVKLGKMLFYETRISLDGRVSCERCHPISLYGADGLRTAVGNNCKTNPKNTPTIFNAADQISEHWTGNRKDVEDQAKQSVIGPPSFGMPSYEAVEQKIKEIEGYIPLFKKAFPGEADPVTMDNFAKAIGAFERTLITPSSFDAFMRGEKGSYTNTQRKGLTAFMESGCTGCHSGIYIGGQMYQKFGITEPYWMYTHSDPVDEGRFAVTKKEADRYVFKVPVLRNVEKTAPYFHDGSVNELEKAIWIMGKVQLGKDLSDQHVENIKTFLQSLTGEIPADALKVPVLPSKE